MNYYVVQEKSAIDLATSVNRLTEHGWKPHGSMIVIRSGNLHQPADTLYTQAVTLDHQLYPKERVKGLGKIGREKGAASGKNFAEAMRKDREALDDVLDMLSGPNDDDDPAEAVTITPTLPDGLSADHAPSAATLWERTRDEFAERYPLLRDIIRSCHSPRWRSGGTVLLVRAQDSLAVQALSRKSVSSKIDSIAACVAGRCVDVVFDEYIPDPEEDAAQNAPAHTEPPEPRTINQETVKELVSKFNKLSGLRYSTWSRAHNVIDRLPEGFPMPDEVEKRDKGKTVVLHWYTPKGAGWIRIGDQSLAAGNPAGERKARLRTGSGRLSKQVLDTIAILYR